MGELGPELRRLREAKHADLEQAAAATKVGVHHLNALERGDHAALPGDVFVRGFVRAYADFLGADSGRLLALYRRERERIEPEAGASADQTVQEMSRILKSPSGRSAAGSGPVLRIMFDGRIGKLAFQFGTLAAACAAIVVLVLVVSARRGVESARPAIDGPLRASRKEIVPPAEPSIPDSASDPVAAPAPPPSLDDSAALPAPADLAPTVVPDAEAESRDAQLSADGVEVPEHGVGSQVEKGQLLGRAASFEEGTAVWFWTRIDGGQPGQIVRHVWIRGDREVHSIELQVGGAQWRTWSRKTLSPHSAGHWSVEARDAYGRVLASDEFECLPKP